MSKPSTDLWGFVRELQSIYERADNERLSVWLPEIKSEFPELYEEVLFCATMPNPTIVKRYLMARDPRFVALQLVPNVDRIIQFLMDFINERREPNAIPLPTSTLDSALPRQSRNRARRHPSGT